MGFNPFALSASERNKRMEFRCKHRHNGISHWNCYNEDCGLVEKVGFLDIESSSLVATYGIIWSYCIKEENGKTISNVITPNEMKKHIYDKRLLKDFCNDVRKFNRVMTWYGAKFDIPMLRTRCLFWGLDFPLYKEISHTDLYYTAKHKLKLHSNKLEVVAKFFGIKAKAHPLLPEIWLKAFGGEQEALDYILTHNKEDVITTEKVYYKLQDCTRLTKTSI